jgi:guanylate kinase
MLCITTELWRVNAQVEDALAANADVVLRIDVQGAATVRRMMPDAVSIFLVSE